MKKLDQFLVKSFLIAFFSTLAVVLFIFTIQFLWVYIDELVGKGLGMKVILEFLGWACATLFPLCIPLATLLSSIMTIGQMAEHNELLAMKSTGISLMRIFAPLIIVSVFISIGTFFAANNLVPIAFNNIYTLRDDFGRTKAEISIPTGTFYNGIEGYILRVNSKTKHGTMKNVMVYDHSDNKGNNNLTLADSAKMSMSANKSYLIFKFYNGINYKEDNNYSYSDSTRQLQRIKFSKQELVIPLENYAFQQSKEAKFGDQVRCMTILRLKKTRDSLMRIRDSLKDRAMLSIAGANVFKYYKPLIDSAKSFKSKKVLSLNKLRPTSLEERIQADQYAVGKCDEMIYQINAANIDSYSYVYLIRRSIVEFLKKFAQALLCLLLFFIGAPLGSFIRKGNLGIAIIIGVMFFVLYWVVDITGTKLANDGAVKPLVGIFISSLVMGSIGVFLSFRAVQDSSVFKGAGLKFFIRRLKTKFISMFKKTKIVYMGTPEFAVASLDALIKTNHEIAAVVTVADKTSGRGLKVQESAVKQYAKEHNIKVLQPLKLKDPEFLAELKALKADIFVVVAFRMLPKEVWKMPKKGTINLHAALLPQYRGAAPINWAIINGERISGVTTFMIDENIDTGGIILRQDCRIAPEDCAGDLHDKLMSIGSDLLVQTVDAMIEGNVETRLQRSFIQGSEKLKSAPKLNKELCHIDWEDNAKNIYNLIRGLSPYPASFTNISNGEKSLQLKIFFAEVLDTEAVKTLDANVPTLYSLRPGQIVSDNKNYVLIACEDAYISLKNIQLEGRKRMDIKSFLLGFKDIAQYSCDKGSSKEEKEKLCKDS